MIRKSGHRSLEEIMPKQRETEGKPTMAEIIKLDGTRPLDFDREMVEQAYDRWAPVYDLVFGGVFSKGRKGAISATTRLGGRVLEVGVGTGISFPAKAPPPP